MQINYWYIINFILRKQYSWSVIGYAIVYRILIIRSIIINTLNSNKFQTYNIQ